MSLLRRGAAADEKQASERQPNQWDVLRLLMQIAPPPVDGRSWLDGHNDGLYIAQCHLKGAAQGLAMNGKYAEAVTVAQQAVALNALRITAKDPSAKKR